MSETATEPRIKALFAAVLNTDVPSDDTDLIENGFIDSLGLVELLLAIEHEFGVSFALDTLDIESFRTVRRMSAYVATLNGSSGT